MSAVCSACSRAGEDICMATFICVVCYQERSVCTHLPGGLEEFTSKVIAEGAECVMCQEKRTMSEGWIDQFHKKKGGC